MDPSLNERHFRTPSPVSWGLYLLLTLLTGVLLALSACSTGAPQPQNRTHTLIPLRGFHTYTGSVSGMHRYHDRNEPFTITVQGTVEFRPDQVRLGSCVRGNDEVTVRKDGHVRFRCGSNEYDFGNGSGRVSLYVSENWDRRGDCDHYEIRADGSKGPCLEWRWVVHTNRRRTSVVLAMREGGDSP